MAHLKREDGESKVGCMSTKINVSKKLMAPVSRKILVKVRKTDAEAIAELDDVARAIKEEQDSAGENIIKRVIYLFKKRSFSILFSLDKIIK